MKIKIAIITFLLLLDAGLAIFLAVYNQEEFTGSRERCFDTYIADIERMNGSNLHPLTLNAGEDLEIRFETQKGSLRMAIKAQDGTILYSGDGKYAPAFTLYIKDSGIYTVEVKARHAKGKIYIKPKEKTQ